MSERGRGKEIGLAKWRSSAAHRSLTKPPLRPTEQTVFEQLRAEGWEVFRNGWPDFLAVKDGQIKGVEVKSDDQPLRTEQKRVRRVLRAHGIPVELHRLHRDGHTEIDEGAPTDDPDTLQ